MRFSVFIAVVAFAMAGVQPSSASSEYEPPAFCRGVDCPRFTTLKTEKEYEIRKYEVSYWVSTDMYEMSIDTASKTGFWRLFRYITGNNTNNEKISMTCPVLTRVTAGAGPTCESNFTKSFMIPFSHQPSAPPPSEEVVYLSTKPEMTVYVSFAKEPEWIQNAAALADAIGDTNLFDDSHFITAGYDSPYRMTNRHNEVWFIAK